MIFFKKKKTKTKSIKNGFGTPTSRKKNLTNPAPPKILEEQNSEKSFVRNKILTKFSFQGAETQNFVRTPFVHISIIYAQTVYEQNFVQKVLQKNENSSYQKKVEKNIL